MSEHNTQHKVDTHSYKGWLNSDSFWKRAFAILGYNSAASFLIAIPFYLIMFVVMFAMMGLSSSLSDSRDKAEQISQKVNISIVCSEIAYEKGFNTQAAEDKFIADCEAGQYQDEVKDYIQSTTGGDGRAI